MVAPLNVRAVRQQRAQAPTGRGSRTRPAIVVQKIENSVQDCGVSDNGHGTRNCIAAPMEIAPKARPTLIPPLVAGSGDEGGDGGRGGRWLFNAEEGISATHGLTRGSGGGSIKIGTSTMREDVRDEVEGVPPWLLAVAVSSSLGRVTEGTS